MRDKAFVCFAAAFLVGCDFGDRAINIQPGEADYPAENPHPTRIIQITVIAPPTISFRFLQGYGASAPGGTMQSGTACSYAVGWPDPPRRYSVMPPMKWVKQGDIYRGQIILDQYEPGRCGWNFAGVWYFVPNASQDNRRELFFYDGDSQKPSDYRVDIWCHNWPNKPSTQDPDCGSIDAFKSAASGFTGSLTPEQMLPKDTYDDIVARGGRAGPPVRVGSKVQSITIQFHDMRLKDGDFEIRTSEPGLPNLTK